VFDITGSKPKVFPILATGLVLTYLINSILTFSSSATETETTDKTTLAQNPELQTPQDFSRISEFHLFGQSASTSSVGGLPAETTLPLKLKGVLYLPDNHAHAIIEAADQTQKTYRVNDTLPGGAILQTIESNSIVIMSDNRQESLGLAKTKTEQAESEPSTEAQPISPEPVDDIVIQPPESLAN